MPTHPCGQYHHNTLVKILFNEEGMKNLRVIHRLDRMTSGLVLIGKTYEAAMKISSQICDREVCKFYIAEVEGQFKGPDEACPNETTIPKTVTVDQPLGRLSERMGLNAVMPESEGGKPSKTVFVPLLWKKPRGDDDVGSTIVLCRLYSGRTHQVRIHLQYLGFPIVEDPLYNSYDWGPSKGAFAKYLEPRSKLLSALAASRNRSAYLKTAVSAGENSSEGPAPEESVISLSTGAGIERKADEDDNNIEDHGNNEASPPPPKISRLSTRPGLRYYNEATVDEATKALLEAAYDADCPDCNRRFMEPKICNLVLRLHAYRYAGSDWSYSAPLPSWALESMQSEELEALIAERLPLL